MQNNIIDLDNNMDDELKLLSVVRNLLIVKS